MRNPKRIQPTLEAVRALWYLYPDMRLGQLLWYIAGDDPFHMEDEALIEIVKEKLNEYSNTD